MSFGLDEKLSEVRELTWEAIEEYSSLLNRKSEDRSKKPSSIEALDRLSVHLHYVSRGIDALIATESIECAFILRRSAFEATFKALFIAFQEQSERDKTATELLSELTVVYGFRNKSRASAAANFSKKYGDADSERVYSFIAETDDIPTSNQSRNERKALEQRWAFPKIHDWLIEKFDSEAIEFPFDTVLYDYGMSSHLLHVDGIGLGLELDQDTRPLKEAENKRVAEGCKIYSDLLLCWLAIGIGAKQLLSLPEDCLKTSIKLHRDFYIASEPYFESFSRSQDSFYDKTPSQ